MKKAEDWFIALWCLVMPINNFVLFPSISGSIPAYVCALISLGFITARMLTRDIDARLLGYFKILFIAALIWILLLVGSQLGHIIDDRSTFGEVPMVGATNPGVLFRVELFTQSMYLFACILVALYFRFFFRPHMMRYVFWGGYLMAGYGIYEWLFYLIFKQPGDFLGNRIYGMGTEDGHTGSWSQDIDFAGIDLLRIKSTFGEPSFFSAAVVPYFFVALDNRKHLLTGLLFFAAFFSTSTSCYLSLAACFLVRSLWVGKKIGQNVGIALLLAVALYGMASLFPDTFAQLFGDKLSGSNDSGQTHQRAVDELEGLLTTFSPMNWIFGIGVGYIYAEVTIAVFFNTGLIGLGLFLYMFFKPIFGLKSNEPESLGFKSALFGIFFAYTINVAELYLPTTWMFIGLAYWRLTQEAASVEPAKPTADVLLTAY